jgi:Trypsin
MTRLALVLAALAVALPTAAHAVWGGQEDTAHPGIGVMYFDAQGTGALAPQCSGSFAGRSTSGAHDVFLTAGHCLPPPGAGVPAGRFYVSFNRNARVGLSSTIQATAYHQMPGFGHDFGDSRDLGVLLLPAGSVPAGTPSVQLPPEGYLDRLKANRELNFRVVDIVGYGVIPVWDQPGPTQFVFDGIRRSGTTVITGLGKAVVHYNQQRHGIGTGSGLCFGDSGSPQLERGTLLVVSITSVGNSQCNAGNSNYRVDTPQARAFLGQFLTLP